MHIFSADVHSNKVILKQNIGIRNYFFDNKKPRDSKSFSTYSCMYLNDSINNTSHTFVSD